MRDKIEPSGTMSFLGTLSITPISRALSLVAEVLSRRADIKQQTESRIDSFSQESKMKARTCQIEICMPEGTAESIWSL